MIEQDQPEFAEFCKQNGINLQEEDDWGTWWECWIAGYNACQNEIHNCHDLLGDDQ